MPPKRQYEQELLAQRDAMNSQIRQLLKRKDELAQEILGTKKTVGVKRAAIVAREAGLRPGVPVEWVRDQVEPEEDGSYSVDKVREWGQKNKLTVEEPERKDRDVHVGSPPADGPARPQKALGQFVGENEKRERLKGGRFTG